ncbi:MAG: aldehyde dehydrogenase family protein [Gemmatimonadaceae bacterium]|nr:aldehyde dehydrogenase family protein [Gemmatimonadaceae bacterium]
MDASTQSPPRRRSESRDPVTGDVFRNWETTDDAAVAAAVARARAAQADWAARAPADRAAVLDRFHDLLFARRRAVAEAITRELGKPLIDAMAADVTVSLEFARFYAREGPRFLRPRWRGVGNLAFWRKRARVERRPYGVIGIIAPWNYPFWMPVSGAMPALVTGNAVVLKPSEFTPGAAMLLQDLLREAGLPAGVFEVVPGDGVTGAALVRSGVDRIVFTGSSAVGRKVAVACAERFIPCALELGGSDPAIVLADADLRFAADGIVWNRFFNGGQNCVSPKRIFVEQPVFDAFVAAAARAVGGLVVGDPKSAATEVGPLVRPHAVATIRAQLDDALAKGARIVAQAPVPAGDGFFPPTLITGVTDDMRVMQEETFGPLLPVVAVRDADEAVRRANATSYGLSASVWTGDAARGVALARRLEAGSIQVNDAVNVVGMADIATGGVKASGLGRHHGLEALEDCVKSTPVVDDRFARWRQPWWFPYLPGHLDAMDAFTRLSHAPTLAGRLSGLVGTLRLVLTRKGRA